MGVPTVHAASVPTAPAWSSAPSRRPVSKERPRTHPTRRGEGVVAKQWGQSPAANIVAKRKGAAPLRAAPCGIAAVIVRIRLLQFLPYLRVAIHRNIGGSEIDILEYASKQFPEYFRDYIMRLDP